MENVEKRRSGVQSIEVGLRVMMPLANSSGSMALKEISALADIPPSRCHRYLVSLIRGGLVVQELETGRYNLGPGALKLGLSALHRLDVMHFSAEALKTLQQETGQTAMMTLWSESGPTIVRMLESDTPIIVNIRIGSTLPILTSAAGQVFMSYLARPVTQRLVDGALARIPPESVSAKIRDEADIQAMIANVRANGVSQIREDLLPGLEAIAAPVFDSQGNVSAAFALLTPSGGLACNQGKAPRLLQSIARDVSERMGYQA